MNSIFTGERFIPGQGGCQIAYEHLHRYFFAMRWAAGKRVLDAACGAGYGSALLSGRARSVWAIDIDESAIQNAKSAWRASNLHYIRGDAAKLPFRSSSMDLIVAMEAIEHIEDQEGLVQEFARVCNRDGVVLISTPNKNIYSDAREYSNPFHIHEFNLEEFTALLSRHFSHIRIFNQQIRAGSFISSNRSGHECEIITEPSPNRMEMAAEPMYFIAICGNEEISIPSGSVYLDTEDGLIGEWKEETSKLNDEIRQLGSWGQNLQTDLSERDRVIQSLQGQVNERDRVIQSLQCQVNERDRVIQSLQGQMSEEIDRRDRQIVDLIEELKRMESEYDDRGRWAISLQDEVKERDATIRRISGELHQVESHLARIRHAFLYRILRRIGLLPK